MPKSQKSGAVKRVPRSLYEPELERLQAELVGMQQWVVETGARVLVIFEGRDAAGKGGAIKRRVQYQCTPGVSSAFGYGFS
jgi:polyphosphate kinase 2 (PPK2 family)